MQSKPLRVLAVTALTAALVAVLSVVAFAHGRRKSAVSPAQSDSGVVGRGALDTIPKQPATGYKVDVPFFETDGLGQYEGTKNAAGQKSEDGGYYTSGYWVDVPRSYQRNNEKAETLLVWLHACNGLAHWDVQALTSVYALNNPFMVIAPSGPEGRNHGGPICWNTNSQTDVNQVLTDISQVETHFNIDRRRVIISGYSSGGDLAYQTIFTHADVFAGILGFNTDPVSQNIFRGSTSKAIAAAARRFPIFQVIHASDIYYPPSLVQPHLEMLSAAGFPVHLIVRPGHHYDANGPAGCPDKSCTSGTYYDIAHYLLPQIAADGWEAPGS